MNQKIVHDLVDELAIYAYDLSISQADVPYTVIAHARPAGTKKLSLYVDHLTITGDLVNPGQDLTVVARVVDLAEPSVLDIGGPDPVHTFAPGDLPLQKDTSFGAAGVSGLDATAPLASGNLTWATGQMVVTGALGAGVAGVESLDGWVAARLSTATIRQALASLPIAFQISMADVMAGTTGMVDVGGALLLGAEQFTVTRSSLDHDTGDVFVDLALPSLSLGGSVELLLDGIILTEATTMTSMPFTASVRLHVTATGGASSGQRVNTIAPIQITFTGLPAFTLDAAGQASLGAGILSSLSTPLLPHISDLVADAPGSVALTLLAQGGNGGRGQDGQSGIVGKAGVNGFTPAGSRPGLVDNGVLISYPAEAKGTDGSAGGAAGSAGHSTSASAGGQIVIAVGAGGSAPILLSNSGGRGGDAATPGAPGSGGAGGAGSEIEVYVAGDAPGQVQSMDAPSGSDGAPGASPQFAGAIGSDGVGGSVVFDGAPWSAQGPISAVSDTPLATFIPLALLLMTDQGNAVDHLDARTSADLIEVVARYHWLIGVTKPFLAADPSHGAFSAADITVRQAINQSAKVELARISQGLDYYGEAFNWVPVLSMAALQSRVASLLDLGQIVETTYDKYQASGAQSETQLSELDNTLGQLQTKITADKAASEQLKADIQDAEAQVKASLAPVIAQQNRLAVAEFDFKQEFIVYVLEGATGCTFLNVLKGLLCVVEFVAEAVVGIGEISALTEAATITELAAGVVKVIKTAEVEIEAIQHAVESVQALMDTDIDAAKVVVDEQKFNDFIAQYLGKFPAATELADAVHQYFALIQAHNKLALAYTGLVIKQARLQANVTKNENQVEAITARRAVAKADEVLPEYTAFMTSAYWDLKAELLRELFEFNRAYTYWSLHDRPFFATDETIANLATAYAGWLQDIDTFLEQTGPVQPFKQQLNITAADYPEAFALLTQSRRLNVNLDIQTLAPKYFPAMSHIVATKLSIALPDIHPTSGALLIELAHSGLARQNSAVDVTNPANIHTFSHARRNIPYKIDYGNPANTAGGLIGDQQQGFPGLSPFTMWEISFDVAGNEWLDLTQIKTVELTFEGTFLLGTSAEVDDVSTETQPADLL